jgi:hypothetical protein
MNGSQQPSYQLAFTIFPHRFHQISTQRSHDRAGSIVERQIEGRHQRKLTKEGRVVRGVTIISVLAAALALPAAAQQLTEQQARQIAEKLLKLDNKAWTDKSCAEEGMLYVEDAIRVFPKGSLRGRTAIEKWFCGPMTDKDWVQNPSTLDQVKVVSDNVILYTGEWSGTWNGPKGPEPYKGRWAKTVVREGDTWQWVMSVDNNAPNE